jgi:hypothetical protein
MRAVQTAVVWLALGVASEHGDRDWPGPSHLEPGANVCESIRKACGSGMDGAICMKRVLSRLLPSTADMHLARSRLFLPLEFYFLCSGIDTSVNSTSDRVQFLTALLRQAAATGQAQHMALYQAESKPSKLLAWSTEEKLAHFQHCVESILPDNLHCIDRLAVTLAEDTDPLDATTRELRLKARALLLHYAVLRQIIAHPLQRPLVFFHRLTARPFWAGGRRSETSITGTSPLLGLVHAFEAHFDELQVQTTQPHTHIRDTVNPVNQ